ncbi:Fe-S cluster assembly protein SufD [Niabella ginsengisoli]|uniref:Fe-S cluster assembly protein SufD n=1 Tax=Niabella ginsengisoli TaxID=522298 RepID=A0ABS9SK99_9BACT|nr:Fe-S cluster assembly protein SufD [Niabella ginsengisoli]MCH5598809.1 Fe-S cluster assembly protein SufD [Niabella ginsengisoli]
MDTISYFKERFEKLQTNNVDAHIKDMRDEAFTEFEQTGIPTVKHEEWKYTRINDFFNKDYHFTTDLKEQSFTVSDLSTLQLPGHEDANLIVFVNGHFHEELSHTRSDELEILSLQSAAGHDKYASIVKEHLGHSADYHKDGINALNTAFIQEGVFVHVFKSRTASHPIYLYNITDARNGNIFAQPRSLVHVAQNAQVQMVETFVTIGADESFTNQVIELVVEKDAILDLYKIQNDEANSKVVSTTHVHQIGKSVANVVTVCLNGGLIRNNLNMVMSAEYCEANLFGLYLGDNQTHIDNHTVVDNRQPNCLSNELYKGVLNGNSTGVFNGKIFVRQIAQKTNAYQSNRNILLSENASVNAKPQLEIFADDVKCSHGCTVGSLDEDALFYMRSRGIEEKTATSLLLHGFALDVLEKIKHENVRTFVEGLVTKKLDL